jgi:hypothetical protein
MKKLLSILLLIFILPFSTSALSEDEVWMTLTGTLINEGLEDDFRNIDIV